MPDRTQELDDPTDEVTMGLEDPTEEDLPIDLFPSPPHYEIHYGVYPPGYEGSRMRAFLDTVNEAVTRGGTVVQWMQTSVTGNPATGGMMTQITAIVEFRE